MFLFIVSDLDLRPIDLNTNPIHPPYISYLYKLCNVSTVGPGKLLAHKYNKQIYLYSK
jgi:hypothetical protein